MATVAAVCASYFEKALSRLFDLPHDPRWRVREAVAMAIQRLIEARPKRALSTLEGWIQNDDWLAMRAVAAGVAEPRLAKEQAIAEQALKLHRAIVACIVASADRRSEEFKAFYLGQTLGVDFLDDCRLYSRHADCLSLSAFALDGPHSSLLRSRWPAVTLKGTWLSM